MSYPSFFPLARRSHFGILEIFGNKLSPIDTRNNKGRSFNIFFVQMHVLQDFGFEFGFGSLICA
jgi:hypothetical protein